MVKIRSSDSELYLSVEKNMLVLGTDPNDSWNMVNNTLKIPGNETFLNMYKREKGYILSLPGTPYNIERMPNGHIQFACTESAQQYWIIVDGAHTYDLHQLLNYTPEMWQNTFGVTQPDTVQLRDNIIVCTLKK